MLFKNEKVWISLNEFNTWKSRWYWQFPNFCSFCCCCCSRMRKWEIKKFDWLWVRHVKEVLIVLKLLQFLEILKDSKVLISLIALKTLAKRNELLKVLTNLQFFNVRKILQLESSLLESLESFENLESLGDQLSFEPLENVSISRHPSYSINLAYSWHIE